MEETSSGVDGRKLGDDSCLQRLMVRLRLVDKDATPPQWKYIGLVYLALTANSTAVTYLFPFLPEMMLHFGYQEHQKGSHAGMVASTFFAGMALAGLVWGWLADHYGRKVVLVVSLLLGGLLSFLFGFSTSLPIAMLFRFLCGAACGTVVTCKTILYDISDNSNQAVGMSILSISWGMGMMAGPLVGGILASPCKKWPDVFSQSGLFGQFPYLLSSMFPFVLCLLVVVLLVFTFDETFLKTTKRPSDGKSDTDSLKHADNHSLEPITDKAEPSAHVFSLTNAFYSRSFADLSFPVNRDGMKCYNIKNRAASEPFLASDEASALVSPLGGENKTADYFEYLVNANQTKSKPECGANEKNSLFDKVEFAIGQSESAKISILGQEMPKQEPEKNTIDGIMGSSPSPDDMFYQDGSREEESSICQCVDSLCLLACCRPCTNSSMHHILRLNDVWMAVTLYALMAFAGLAVDDVFPVFASTRKDYGGLGFDTKEIGLAIGVLAIPMLLLQVKVFPFLVAKYGIRKSFCGCGIVAMACSQLIPMVKLLNYRPTWLWVCVLTVQVPYKISVDCLFAGTSLFINNSVRQDQAGQVNGLGMLVSSVTRFLAPLSSGSLFSWTVTYGQSIGPPVDTSFTFFILGLVYAMAVLECLLLDPRLDRQKK